MLKKLYGIGIHPVLITWIANFLIGREQRTRVGNHYSSSKRSNAGVPQGKKLGTPLFLLLVSDLSVSDDTVKFLDDSTIWEMTEEIRGPPITVDGHDISVVPHAKLL